MHQILRQVVEVDVHGSEHVGLEVQRQVSAVCRHAVSAHLEDAFAAFDADDRTFLIDRLDVDLGDVRLEDLETALTTSLSTAVATTLRERGFAPRPPASIGTPDQPGLTQVEALFAGVLHFLRHGRLPWWYASQDSRPLEERLMALLSPEAGDAGQPGGAPTSPSHASFIEDLTQLLRSSGRARARLLHQFSTSSVLVLLEWIDVGLHGRALQALQSIRSSSLGGPSLDQFEAGLVEAAVDSLASGSQPETTGDLLRESAARLGSRLSVDERELLARRLGVEVQADRDERVRPPVQPPPGDESVVGDGLFVEGAGVVLLHPFLPRFFETLGIACEDALVEPARAALLLHHLVTGALTAEEHELVLAKVLCGLPIESTVPREAPVSPEEQAEAIAVLDSAVRHWSALRNTSADGLRGNFLARRGRIELCENDWVLRVEPRSYDMLLDSLPWGVAHVRLPWMPRLMHVEWTA